MWFTHTQIQNDHRKHLGQKMVEDTLFHLVFTGNTGTRKTTFARCVAAGKIKDCFKKLCKRHLVSETGADHNKSTAAIDAFIEENDATGF